MKTIKCARWGDLHVERDDTDGTQDVVIRQGAGGIMRMIAVPTADALTFANAILDAASIPQKAIAPKAKKGQRYAGSEAETWEDLPASDMQRLRVPGGWLYRVAYRITSRTTFVPMPAAVKHKV